MPEMPEQSDFFDNLQPAEDKEWIEQQKEIEERTRLAEEETKRKYRKKPRVNQADPLAGVKLGSRDKKYHWE